MKKNDLLYGFRVANSTEYRQGADTLWEFRHEKTGAALYWLQNSEENKLFAVAFKTPPSDNTGVFHILEHCVLCGSERFPVKNPFNELRKCSMYTHLNAFTARDYTMFPVSSQNEKDFFNLTTVYLDAVFCPRVLREESIFLQEGCRIDFSGDAPSYNGVVFNEMKGEDGAAHIRLCRIINRALFPNTCYACDSGGDPAEIVTLSYEKLLSTYRKYYHPSNGVFYLDGDLPIEKALSLVDSYIGKFSRSNDKTEIPPQPEITFREARGTYDPGKNGAIKNKTLLGFAKYSCRYEDYTKILALSVLNEILFGSTAAPMKQAVLKTGLAKNVFCFSDYRLLYPYFVLVFDGTEEKHKNRLIKTVRDEALRLLADGSLKETLLSELDTYEILLKKHIDTGRGLHRAKSLVEDHLYGAETMQDDATDLRLKELRSGVDTGYFEDILREYFVQWEYNAEAVLTPDPEKTEKGAAEIKARLNAALSDPETCAAEKSKYCRFRLWRETPDTEAAKASIPRLSISDLDPLPKKYNTEIKQDGHREILFHAYDTNGFSYVQCIINISDLSAEELPAFSFLSKLLGKLPTATCSEEALHKRMRRLFCDFKISVMPISPKHSVDKTTVYLFVRFSTLNTMIGEACALVKDILLQTRFNDRKLIRHYLTLAREHLYRDICSNGDFHGMLRASAVNGPRAAVGDLTMGIGQYRWLKATEENYNAGFEALSLFGNSVMHRVCSPGNLMISETSNEFHPQYFSLFAAFPAQNGGRKELTLSVPFTRRFEAFAIPGNTSFTAFCANVAAFAEELSGKEEILSKILTGNYLNLEIRTNNGAYGARCDIGDDVLQLTSWHDPNPLNSLHIFASLSQYISVFSEEEESIESYIISCASVNTSVHPAALAQRADRLLLMGITYEDRCRHRRELLSMKKEDLLRYRSLFENAAKTGSACIIGGKDILKDLDETWSVSAL